MDEDALDAAREAVAATRAWREQMRHDWGIYREPEEVLDAAVGELLAERDRLRAALTLIAIPPSNIMRDDHEFTACTGCAHVAQRALDGHDYQPNVAALDGRAEATDG